MFSKGSVTSSDIAYQQSDVENTESEISYTPTPSAPERLNRMQERAHETSRPASPKVIPPEIRKNLHETNQKLLAASEAIREARSQDSVDVVELANAMSDYRECVATLWICRDYGQDAWRRVIAFCRQALVESTTYEEMTFEQCQGLITIAHEYLPNRMLARDDVRDVMNLLKSSGFDPFLFISSK